MYTPPQSDSPTSGQDEHESPAHDNTSANPHVDTTTRPHAAKEPSITEPMLNGILTAAHPAYRTATPTYPHPYAPARPHAGTPTPPYIRTNVRPKVYS